MNDTFLVGLTSFLNLLFLISSLWLGLYILLRNPGRKLSWLISATLWSLSGSFLNTLTFLHTLPGEGSLPWWWGWSVAIAVPFWFHLSVELLPGEQAERKRTLMVFFYLLTLNLIAMEAYTPWIFTGVGARPPVYYSSQQPGRLFPLYGLYLTIAPALSLMNFRRGWRLAHYQALRHQFTLLQVASLLAVTAGVYATLSIWLHLETPTLISTCLLGSGVLLLGYGVIRWNALVEGRVQRQDFFYSAVATGLIAIGYLLVALLSNLVFDVPFIAFIFLVCFAIITHSLYDFGLGILDRSFSSRREHFRLWSSLRELGHSVTVAEDLYERLQTLLESLCDALTIRQGWIALRGEETIISTLHQPPEGWKRRELFHGLAADEMQVLTDRENPDGGEILAVPLLHGGINLGAIVLKPRHVVERFSDEDLDLIEAFADRVADVVYTVSLQKDTIAHIETMAQQFKQQERELRIQMRKALEGRAALPSPSAWDEAAFSEHVEDALKNIGDYSYLGEHPLADLEVVDTFIDQDPQDRVTHLDRGKILHQLLTTCIQKLKPPGSRSDPPTREWRAYVILQEGYVEGMRTRDVMNALYISEATFHRARRRAVKAVAKALQEMERSVKTGNLPPE